MNHSQIVSNKSTLAPQDDKTHQELRENVNESTTPDQPSSKVTLVAQLDELEGPPGQSSTHNGINAEIKKQLRNLEI
jgi:hypothetical protein